VWKVAEQKQAGVWKAAERKQAGVWKTAKWRATEQSQAV